MKLILRSQQIDHLKMVVRVRAAQLFRLLREYYPPAGLPLAACLSLIRWRRGDNCFSIDSQPRSILVIRLDAMGDLVMATPIFRELKKAYPTAIITALVQKGNFEILETNPFVDRIITLLPAKRAFPLQRLRRDISIVRLYWQFFRGKHFDLALQPRVGPDYFGANLLLTFVSASCRAKYEDDLKSGLSKYLANVAYRSITKLPRPALQHEVLSNRAFVKRITGQAFDCKPEVFLSSADRSYSKTVCDRFQSGSTIVCIAFGAQAKRRQWPIEHWAETVCLLAQNHNLDIVILCSRADTLEAERLRSMLNSVSGTKTWIVSGARLREVAACIKVCDLLLGTDSGVAHLAAAVGCSVMVVSPHPVNGDPQHENSPLRFKPFSDWARVVQPETSRYPCHGGCDAVESHCILNLKPSQIKEMAEEMLLARRSVSSLALRSQGCAQQEYTSQSRTPETPLPHASA